jgi:hypothetical protein
MAITFDEVSVDLREPEADAPAKPSAAAPAGGPEIEERVEQMLRVHAERRLRLVAD